MKGWGFNLVGTQKKGKKEIQEELLDLEILEEKGALDDDQHRKKVEMTIELHQILENEQLYWYKRSHETWLLKGDNNIEFFHRVASGRKRKKTIFSLKEGENVVTGNENLLDLATRYYKNLFGLRLGNLFEIDPGLWVEGENVSPLENEELTKVFSELEIKTTLFQMGKIKQLVLMRFLSNFIKHVGTLLRKT
jgi:hypothetical protein